MKAVDMERKGHCAFRKADKQCSSRSVRDNQMVQPFPSNGPLRRNLGLPLAGLKEKIKSDQNKVYSYVLMSVEIDHTYATFQQRGSGPNFQGGALTLCTCKHRMRASLPSDDWKGVWVAGFTSRTIYDGKHWLFYLAKIESGYESHSDLWYAMTAGIRNSKAADRHFLGDVFRPKAPQLTGAARYKPTRYVMPTDHTHRLRPGDSRWKNDISYCHADKYGHPALLVAAPKQTYLWDEPIIYFDAPHCRNFQKWGSLSQFLGQLREVK
jgi:hypothetical protein